MKRDILNARSMKNSTVRISLEHNESYWLPDKKLADAYRTPDTHTFSTYPAYDELRKAIGAYVGVAPESITIAAGSDAAIRTLVEHYAREGKRGLLPVPTFYGYERIISHAKLPCETVCYTEKDGAFIFPLEATLERMNLGKIDVLFLCQPNNPLGCEIPKDTFETLLDTAAKKNVVVVSDEAYFEFAGLTARHRFEHQPLVIVRTFSKGFGLSGARVGYTVADTGLADILNKALLPWPVAHPSVYAALRALELHAHAKERVGAVTAEREVFRASLMKIVGVERVYPSTANFLLVRLPNAENIAGVLKEEGVTVARPARLASDTAAKTLLTDTLRMSVPSPDDRERVLEALTQTLHKA